MIEVHPGYSVVIQHFVADFEGAVRLAVGLRQGDRSCLGGTEAQIVLQLVLVIDGEDAVLVHAELFGHVELSVDDAVAHDLLHHLPLRRLAVSSADEVAAVNSRDGLAELRIGAAHSFRFCLIWHTLLRDHVPIFSEEAVEEGPSSFAPLVHVVAGHQLLRRKLRHLSAVFQLEPGFDDLSKRYSVARSASLLVSDWTQEVIPLDVREIICSWDL